MTETGYVLGIDGGGTATKALLATSDGRAVAMAAGGPSNYQAVGAELARASLAAAIEGALAAAPGGPVPAQRVGAVVAGLAGLHVVEDHQHLTALIGSLLPGSRVKTYNDGEVAQVAATGGRAGIVVVAGTGSIAVGADERGRTLRCSGWGHAIGDEGSAYAIVRQGLRLASQAVDGRAPATALVAAFVEAFGVASFDDVLHPIYGPPAITRQELAALAPLVVRCARDGDAAARAILTEAAADLALMATTLARRLNLGACPFPVAYSGSVWSAGDVLLGPFQQCLHAAYAQAEVGPPLLTPAAGAALLAIGLLSDKAGPDPTVLENLRRAPE